MSFAPRFSTLFDIPPYPSSLAHFQLLNQMSYDYPTPSYSSHPTIANNISDMRSIPRFPPSTQIAAYSLAVPVQSLSSSFVRSQPHQSTQEHQDDVYSWSRLPVSPPELPLVARQAPLTPIPIPPMPMNCRPSVPDNTLTPTSWFGSVNNSEIQRDGGLLQSVASDRRVHTSTSKDRTKAKRLRRFHCVGCDAVFERPSTLRQHMFSHTGEKPHPCHICGRRFSVSSNLRRHLKSCEASEERFADATAAYGRNSPVASGNSSIRRVSGSMARARSAPKWIPESLAALGNAGNLASNPPFAPSASAISVTVPLPPVSPHGTTFSAASYGVISSDGSTQGRDERMEERNSWATCALEPYHPTHWNHRLPGPGLLEADELIGDASKFVFRK